MVVYTAPPTPLAPPHLAPHVPTLSSTLSSTLEIYAVRHGSTVVSLATQPVSLPSPWSHADELLSLLVRDTAFAGQKATEIALSQFYLLICHRRGHKPFDWSAVRRQLNVLLRRVYGEERYKGDETIPEGGRLQRRRVYRVPTLEEIERAFAEPDTVVELLRRRAS
jgi:hypothetical protein